MFTWPQTSELPRQSLEDTLQRSLVATGVPEHVSSFATTRHRYCGRNSVKGLFL